MEEAPPFPEASPQWIQIASMEVSQSYREVEGDRRPLRKEGEPPSWQALSSRAGGPGCKDTTGGPRLSVWTTPPYQVRQETSTLPAELTLLTLSITNTEPSTAPQWSSALAYANLPCGFLGSRYSKRVIL